MCCSEWEISLLSPEFTWEKVCFFNFVLALGDILFFFSLNAE